MIIDWGWVWILLGFGCGVIAMIVNALVLYNAWFSHNYICHTCLSEKHLMSRFEYKRNDGHHRICPRD